MNRRLKILSSIIAVHGLGSNPETTWTNPETGTHWLRDILALQFSTCRIVQVNHDSRWDAQSPVQSLRDYGQTILDSISRLRFDAVVKVPEMSQNDMLMTTRNRNAHWS